ncbi:hypothetical protein BDL97_16G022200 [Sphagnum fallax]|nr:hypothetical protein BDL97_16G022200 [Sphagnum fallax]
MSLPSKCMIVREDRLWCLPPPRVTVVTSLDFRYCCICFSLPTQFFDFNMHLQPLAALIDWTRSIPRWNSPYPIASKALPQIS